MSAWQVWLVHTLGSVTPVGDLMRLHWSWPFVESLHFIGLSLLFGTVGLFDLRLLGFAKRIPMPTLHRLIPWGLAGFGLNLTTGALFLMTEPDQYIYNPSFHFKLLFIGAAGVNALSFYALTYRQTMADPELATAPPVARVLGAISLCLWIGVIISGRLLTFYRPAECGPEGPGFIAECVP
jgi:hypothetical protein